MVALGAVVNDNDVTEPALYGVLSPAVQVVEDDTFHWINGFDYETLECNAEVRLTDICNTSKSVTAVAPTGGPLWRKYFPFAVQTEFKCSTMSRTPAEIQQLANRALEACLQKAVENELWAGGLSKQAAIGYTDGEYPNRYLASTGAVDVTPTPGTPVKTKLGLALLERRLASCGCGARGTIHATRDVASALAPKNADGHLETPLGNYIIAGSGYTGTGPNGNQPAGTQAWMYATGGQIKLRLGPVETVPGEVNQAVKTSTNEIIYKVERPAAVTWNSCCHAAVLVDLSLDYA